MARPDDLSTRRLILRPPSISDVDRIYELCRNREIIRRTGMVFNPYRREHAIRFIKSIHSSHRKGDAWHWSVRFCHTDELLGMVTLYRSKRSPTAAEIGCWLGQPYWGQGIMSEAFARVITYGFRRLHFKRIFAHIFPDNMRSIQLVESLGFAYEGKLRSSAKIRGKWCDECIYAALREDWHSGLRIQ